MHSICYFLCFVVVRTLHWRDNECDGVSNHKSNDCLLNRIFRRRSKKTSKLRITGRWPVNSPHKGPVTRKMFPFDDVIMIIAVWAVIWSTRWMRRKHDAQATSHTTELSIFAPNSVEVIVWTEKDHVGGRIYADSKVHGANTWPTWGRWDPGGPHVGPMNLAIWVYTEQKRERPSISTGNLIILKTAQRNCLV